MRLVVDWDGTVTERDTQLMAVEHFGDRAILDRAETALDAGDLTLHECIELEFSGLRTPLGEVVDWLTPRVRIRAGFAEFVDRFRPLVLSTSFEQLIRPVLDREGLEVELVCNSVEPDPAGWRPVWRDSARCAECDQACKRASLPAGEIVYVGDGYSDRCAARAAARVFARDGLASYLDTCGADYERFDDFHDVMRALA